MEISLRPFTHDPRAACGEEPHFLMGYQRPSTTLEWQSMPLGAAGVALVDD